MKTTVLRETVIRAPAGFGGGSAVGRWGPHLDADRECEKSVGAATRSTSIMSRTTSDGVEK